MLTHSFLALVFSRYKCNSVLEKEVKKKLEAVDVSIACRLCGGDTGHDIKKYGSTVKRLEKFLKIKISDKTAGLSNAICKECLDVWKSIVMFYQRCRMVHRVLLKIIKKKESVQRIKRVADKGLKAKISTDEWEFETKDFNTPLSTLVPTPKHEENTDENVIISTRAPDKERLIINEENLTNTLNVKERGFVDCFICGGCFYDKKDFLNHLNSKLCTPLALDGRRQSEIVDDTAIICEVCGKTFKTKGHLRSHSEYHVDELCYMCDHCPYRGRTRALLITHLRTHTGYRPHRCDVCNKSFVNASNLKKHKWSHEVSRKYKCNECGKSFVCSTYLKKHIYVNHVGNLRVHRCVTCSKGFPNRYTLKKHRQNAHSELLGMGTATYLRHNPKARIKLAPANNRVPTGDV